MMLELNEENFTKTIEENEYVLIDFWAEWCGPCKTFAKVVEEVGPRYPEFVFGSVNIEEQEQLASDFQIRSVPAILVIRNQVIVYAGTGALPASALADLLDQAKSIDPNELKEEE